LLIDVPAILRRLPLFAGMSEPALLELASRTLVKEYPKNAQLFRRGQDCNGLYVVLEGSVKVYHSGADGREQVLYVEVPIHPLAELPLFDGGPYPASAMTLEDSILLYLSRDAFQSLYRSDPEVADVVIRDLGRRLRRVVQLVNTLTLKDVSGRVATVLLDHAEQAGAARAGGEFTLPVTREALAAAIASTRESVTRTLGAFKRQGIIDIDGPTIRILDLERLRAVTEPTGAAPNRLRLT
jgi:CRP/FNR family transcriptional regulator, cyclic AMP receptor protein